MIKWLTIGGAVALAYLISTGSHGRTPAPGAKSTPLPAAPPVQNPLPPAQAQTTVVPGANSGILTDIQQATNIAGSIADVARKFGLFGGDETATTPATPPPAPPELLRLPNQPNPGFFASGAAFF
jgi:hypothetical protein